MNEPVLSTKPGLLAHMNESHGLPQNAHHFSYPDLYTMHETIHVETEPEIIGHTHIEAEVSEFEQFVRAEAEKKMVEARKVHDAGWQRIAAAVQEAGQAKANLNEARALGTNIMQAASTFRTAEQTMLEAVNNMVDQIAKEFSL